MKKYTALILVALVSALVSGIFTNRSALFGKVFDHLNFHLNGMYSQFWGNVNTSEIKVASVSRRVDNTHLKINDAFLDTKVNLSNSDTAIVVIDPWNLSEPITPNKTRAEGILQNKLIPLVEELLKKDYLTYVATNKCEKNQRLNCGAHEDFPESKNVEFVYHQHETSRSFENKLRKKGIKNLIYIGFASNQCVLGSRSTSMIPMYRSKFKIYYIPDASSALETNETFLTEAIHEATTLTVSQWVAEILDYNEVMSALRLINNPT
jgi:hypothetical protein